MNQILSQQLACLWEVTVNVNGQDYSDSTTVHCQSSPLWKYVDLACQRLGFSLKVGNVVAAVASIESLDVNRHRLRVKLKAEQVKEIPQVRVPLRI